MRIFKVARQGFDDAIDRIFEAVQTLISSRYWALGSAAITIVWFLYESLLSARPVEGWQNGWLYTVFIYTILSYWTENMMKVQTSHMNRIQQEQSDRIEFMLRKLVENSETIQTVLSENQKKDALIRHLVSQWKSMVALSAAKGEE